MKGISSTAAKPSVLMLAQSCKLSQHEDIGAEPACCCLRIVPGFFLDETVGMFTSQLVPLAIIGSLFCC